MDPEDLILDGEDARLKDMIDTVMPMDWGPLNNLKELLLEHALRLRQIRKLAVYNYLEIDGVRYVKASELLMLME